jgi:hypothetical protein
MGAPRCGVTVRSSSNVASEEVLGGEQLVKETEGTRGGSAGVVSPDMLDLRLWNPGGAVC